METRKLELKDIAGNLPYKMCVYDKAQENYFEYAIDSEWSICQVLDDDLLFPILYPFDQIDKPMIHNGKKIVPIVELAKIAYPDRNWKYSKKLKQSVYGCHLFEFRKGGFNSDFWTMQNQYQLFDYLHELKIDYRGLIDTGLAISVYDLKENPYG